MPRTSSPSSRTIRRWGLRIIVLGLGLAGPLALAWWSMRGPSAEARAAITQGKAALQDGRPTAALRAVSRLPEDGPYGAEALTVRGMALVALNRPDEARRALERSLKLEPKQAMAAKVLAAIYFSRNEIGRGMALLHAAAQLDPSDFRPWYGAGDLYRRLDRPAEAAEAFRSALKRRPGDVASRTGLIWALLAGGHTDLATPLLDQALRDRPDDPEVLALAARHARDLGRSSEALRLAERCLAVDPDRVEALLIRARVLRNTGHPDRALADAERAVALDPDDLAALNLLALVESALGLTERAAATSARHRELADRLDQMKQLNQRIEAAPNDPEPRWRLGQVAAASGMTELAIQNFRAALELDPDCRPARDGLAALRASPP